MPEKLYGAKSVWRWVSEWGGDLRHAARRLRATPGTTLLAVLIFALGIGGMTAMYSMGNAMLSPPMRLPQPQRLAMLWQRRIKSYWPTVSAANYRDWQREGRKLARLAAFQFTSATLRLAGQAPINVPAALSISRNFFRTLETAPQQGREFSANEYQPGPARVVILTRTFWQTRLQGAPGMVGKTIWINGHAAQVAGIVKLDFPVNDGVLLPLRLRPQQWRQRKRSEALYVVARRRAGISARAELVGLQAIAGRLAKAHPRTDKNLRAGLISPAVFMNGNLMPIIVRLLLFGAGLLLLLACANVANLELALGLRRSREMALRTALGASRGRLLRQLLSESLLLALAGGAVGALFAVWRTVYIKRELPQRLSREILGWNHFAVDRHALLFALALALASGIVAGLAPAFFAARTRLMGVMKEGGYSISAGKHRLRRLLIIAQMGLAFTLLAASAVALKSMHALLQRTDGFHGDRRLTFVLHLPLKRYPQAQARLQFTQRLLARLRVLPGVEGAALSLSLPWANGGSPQRWLGVGRPRWLAVHKPATIVMAQPVSANFFHLMRLPLLTGRNFSARDGAGAPSVAIVSRSLAETFWPGKSPLGRMLEETGKHAERLRVVGVAPDLHYNLFNRQPERVVYWPYAQTLDSASLALANQLSTLSLTLKTRLPPARLAGAVRGAVSRLDPALASARMQSLSRFFSFARAPLQVIDNFMLSTGEQALLIALIGLYGVMATVAVERRREMGIRMVLGAQARQLQWLSLRQGLRLALWGVVLGLPLAWMANRLLASFMYGVTPMELALLAGVALLLAAAALAASLAPARQAARLDPIEVLRVE